MKNVTGKMETWVFGFIKKQGFDGATDDDLERCLGMRHQTASARRRTLELKGLIVKTDRTRPTRSGRQAAVYVIKEK